MLGFHFIIIRTVQQNLLKVDVNWVILKRAYEAHNIVHSGAALYLH